ncbi:MAG: type II toxin-antitoxin system RelE/ParE family toxin [Dehalococcoidia bacterium]|nr:type II toxin-antitoxin system RelE/ParE family toxin [Dehalococcoidia bacterium]
MSYKIELRHVAQKQLDELPEREYKAIAEIISSLAQKPRPLRVKKLADSGLWRIRVKKYRVVYAIDDEAQMVTIVRIARRREDTYKSL